MRVELARAKKMRTIGNYDIMNDLSEFIKQKKEARKALESLVYCFGKMEQELRYINISFAPNVINLNNNLLEAPKSHVLNMLEYGWLKDYYELRLVDRGYIALPKINIRARTTIGLLNSKLPFNIFCDMSDRDIKKMAWSEKDGALEIAKSMAGHFNIRVGEIYKSANKMLITADPLLKTLQAIKDKGIVSWDLFIKTLKENDASFGVEYEVMELCLINMVSKDGDYTSLFDLEIIALKHHIVSDYLFVSKGIIDKINTAIDNMEL